MHSGGLRSVVDKGERLSEEAVRAMWSLRLSVFSLEPTVDPAVDWGHFLDELRRSTRVLRVFSDEGTLRGFWQQRNVELRVRGQQVVVSMATYGFVDRAWRGHP